jgi:hypothetical protein
MQPFRHWPLLIGALPWAVQIWHWIKLALEWGEHTEFIAHHIEDIRGAWAVITEPPQWINLALLIGGGLLIWWDLRRHRPSPEMANGAPSLATAPPKEEPKKWLCSYDIFEFADQKLMRAARKAEADNERIEREYQAIEERRKELFKTTPRDASGAPISEAFEALKESVAQSWTRLQAQKNVQSASRARALEDIYEKLRCGELIARGFHDPVGNRGEIDIPSAEWRLLRFNGDYTNAAGSGLRYIGITIARAN